MAISHPPLLTTMIQRESESCLQNLRLGRRWFRAYIEGVKERRERGREPPVRKKENRDVRHPQAYRQAPPRSHPGRARSGLPQRSRRPLRPRSPRAEPQPPQPQPDPRPLRVRRQPKSLTTTSSARYLTGSGALSFAKLHERTRDEGTGPSVIAVAAVHVDHPPFSIEHQAHVAGFRVGRRDRAGAEGLVRHVELRIPAVVHIGLEADGFFRLDQTVVLQLPVEVRPVDANDGVGVVGEADAGWNVRFERWRLHVPASAGRCKGCLKGNDRDNNGTKQISLHDRPSPGLLSTPHHLHKKLNNGNGHLGRFTHMTFLCGGRAASRRSLPAGRKGSRRNCPISRSRPTENLKTAFRSCD